MSMRQAATVLVSIAGAAAAIAGYTRGLSANELGLAAATILGMLVLIALARRFEQANELRGQQPRRAAVVLMWTAVGAGVAGTVLILVWATASVWKELRDDAASPPPFEIEGTTSSPKDLPAESTQAPPNSSSSLPVHPRLEWARWQPGIPPLVRSAAQQTMREFLQARRPLVFDKTTFIVPADESGTAFFLSAETIRMRRGARIITNGRRVEIRALHLVVDEGAILAFDPMQSPPASASDGKDGRGGGHLLLASLDDFQGRLAVNLSGQPGNPGTDGGKGKTGAGGRAGDRGQDGLFDCASGAGHGGKGQTGGPGDDGKAGGQGGNGGNLELGGVLTAAASQQRIEFVSKGGAGGPGGKGGAGGDGGPGGAGGASTSRCSGGNAGPPGDEGPAGKPGPSGKPGMPGRVITESARNSKSA